MKNQTKKLTKNNKSRVVSLYINIFVWNFLQSVKHYSNFKKMISWIEEIRNFHIWLLLVLRFASLEVRKKPNIVLKINSKIVLIQLFDCQPIMQ